MKRLYLLICCLIFITSNLLAQNPFVQFGYHIPVVTMTNGRLSEFHDLEEVVEIGSVKFNTHTKQIIGFVEKKREIPAQLPTRFITQDPLAEKYYSISPYVYVANNPLKFIDPDGRKIVLAELTRRSYTGDLEGKKGAVSSKTSHALDAFLITKEGTAFLSQFASKGDKVGSYTFTEDGKYSDHTLNLFDITMSQETANIALPELLGTYGIVFDDDGKATVTIKIVSLGRSMFDVVETIAHEALIHGYKAGEQINEQRMNTQEESNAEHQDLKNKNTNNKGYQQYKNVREFLEALNGLFGTAFQEAEETANKVYK